MLTSSKFCSSFETSWVFKYIQMPSILRLQLCHPDVYSLHGIRLDCYTAVRAALEAQPSPRFARSCRRLLKRCRMVSIFSAGEQTKRFFLRGQSWCAWSWQSLLLTPPGALRQVSATSTLWDTQVWSHERSKILMTATWRCLSTYVYILLHGVYTFLRPKLRTTDILDWWWVRLHNIIVGYRKNLSHLVALEARQKKTTRKKRPHSL